MANGNKLIICSLIWLLLLSFNAYFNYIIYLFYNQSFISWFYSVDKLKYKSFIFQLKSILVESLYQSYTFYKGF